MKCFPYIFFFMLLSSIATSQMIFNADVSAMYDDNIDNNYLQITDKITSGLLNVGYLWSQEKYEINISYMGSINYYTKLIERTNSAHQVLLGYTQMLDKEESTNLDINIGGSTRIDRSIYTLYDHTIYHGKLNIEHYLSDVTTLEANYYLQFARFKNLSDFNHTEHNLGAQLSSSFRTRTSLIIRSDLGIKVYTSETYSTTSTSGSGHGQGYGGQNPTTTTQTSTPTVTQISGLIRVGQSIFEKTGISFTAQYQTNLKKESRYFTSSYGPIPDDVIFDDHYGYEGLFLSAILTQVLPFDSRLRFTFSKQNRIYSSLPAYDLDWTLTSDKRNDKRTVYSAQFKKDFDSIGLSIVATYDYILNSSNDAFYDYVNNAFMVGISLTL